MKKMLHAFAMCQSMFCAIACPWKVWDEEARGDMLLFLPLVGVEIGAVWAAVVWLCRVLALPAALQALVMCLCPYVLTGGIHLDGFMDVTDAVRSWRDVARRREILKDSHVGSFAVVGLAMVLLAGFAVCVSVPEEGTLWPLILIPGVSRCGSALAVTALPPMTTSQYASQKKPHWHLWVLGGITVALVAMGFLTGLRCGLSLLGCLAGYLLALRRAYRSLEGMNGDVAGYALTIGELCGLAVWAVM